LVTLTLWPFAVSRIGPAMPKQAALMLFRFSRPSEIHGGWTTAVMGSAVEALRAHGAAPPRPAFRDLQQCLGPADVARQHAHSDSSVIVDRTSHCDAMAWQD
jgi:hypothetical protein